MNATVCKLIKLVYIVPINDLICMYVFVCMYRCV